MSHVNDSDVPVSKVVQLASFKKKRETQEELARARKPLYVNHADGAISGTQAGAKNGGANEDFADRLGKIKGSLDRINQLMAEIKKLSARSSNSTKDGIH